MLLIFLLYHVYRTRNELKEAKRAIAASIPLGISTSHTDEGPPAQNQINITTEGIVGYFTSVFTTEDVDDEGIDNRPIVQGGGNEATIANSDSMYDDVDNRVSVQGDSLYAEIPASLINDDDGNGDEGAYTNDSVIKMRTKVNEV